MSTQDGRQAENTDAPIVAEVVEISPVLELETETAPGAELVRLTSAERAELVLADSVERAAEWCAENTAENTRRARESARRYWCAWLGAAHGLAEHYPVAPALVLSFLDQHLISGLPEPVDSALQGVKVKRAGAPSLATVESRLSNLATAHRLLGVESPTRDPRVRETLKTARRVRAKAGGQSRKKALPLRDLERLLSTAENDIDRDGREQLVGVRDKALLLTGFSAGGRRRSELSQLTVEQLAEDGGEFVWTVPFSKTDQDGEGLAVPIAGRAAEALAAWLQVAGIESGYVFRSIDRHGNIAEAREDGRPLLTGHSIGQVIKRRAEGAGLNPADFGGHSLRSGFVTTAGRQGGSLAEVMALTGHKSTQVCQRYFQAGNVMRSRLARLAG